MENRFDELAKTLAGGISRRDAMRRIGGGLIAAMIAPFVLGKAAQAAPTVPPAAVNALCQSRCRDCIDPGENPPAFGVCVSSCEVCYNVTEGTPCFCPDPETGEVDCCTEAEVCEDGICAAAG